jgi:hypothetical protein
MRQVSRHCTVHIATPSSYSSPLRSRLAIFLMQIVLHTQLLSGKFLFRQLLMHMAKGCTFGVLNVNPDRTEITQIPANRPDIRFITFLRIGMSYTRQLLTVTGTETVARTALLTENALITNVCEPLVTVVLLKLILHEPFTGLHTFPSPLPSG